MKTLKSTLLGIALSVFSMSLSAQILCPNITALNVAYVSGSTATITPVVTGTVFPTTFYSWNVTPSATQLSYGVFQFPANGSYTVCLTISDSSFVCPTTSSCVVVNAVGITSATCNASFSYYTDSTCQTHFVNTSVGISPTYSWLIDGISYFTSNPIVSLSNGSHSVLLSLYSGGAFCDSTYATINVSCGGGPAGSSTLCAASFNIFADSITVGQYYAYNTSIGVGLTYLWNFGDGTTSTLPYPTHTYSPPGSYIVCLTIYSGTVCTSTTCDSSSVFRAASGFVMSHLNVKPAGSVGIKELDASIGLNAYPNPIENELTIEVSNKDSKVVNYKIIDALGRIVLAGTIGNSKVTFSTSQLERGFYNLIISNETGKTLKTVKLIK
jgi:PKD repeat protein